MPPDIGRQTTRRGLNYPQQDLPDDRFETTRQALSSGDDLRVWSVLVTIFGDLADRPGDRISGSGLSNLTALLSIRPEAVRVALHRLRKDGWIDSEKEGRFSWYFLTETGLRESAIARKRIYACAVKPPEHYRLLAAQATSQSLRSETQRALLAEGYVTLVPGMYLGTETATQPPEDHLVFEGQITAIPDWLKAELAPEALSLGYQALEKALNSLRTTLGENPNLPVLKTAALRTLIVHSWRRLLLRHADLPDAFYPDTWRGPACRRLVNILLEQLERPDPEVLAGF